MKHIIDAQNAGDPNKSISLEDAINLCGSNKVALPVDDKKILKEFKKSHLDYLNLGAHSNLIPTFDRVDSARGCVDMFVKRNV